LLINIFEKQQEAKNTFFRVVDITDDTEDPGRFGVRFFLFNMTSTKGLWIWSARDTVVSEALPMPQPKMTLVL
jgi:hypothetical protein